jgi:hypothetical protein
MSRLTNIFYEQNIILVQLIITSLIAGSEIDIFRAEFMFNKGEVFWKN